MLASQTNRSSFAQCRCLRCSSSSRRTSSTQPRNPQGSPADSRRTSRATRRVSVSGTNTLVQCNVLVFARARQPSISCTSCWHALSSQASALRYGSARQRSQKSSSDSRKHEDKRMSSLRGPRSSTLLRVKPNLQSNFNPVSASNHLLKVMSFFFFFLETLQRVSLVVYLSISPFIMLTGNPHTKKKKLPQTI